MPYTEVSRLLQRGQVDEALRVCLADQSTSLSEFGMPGSMAEMMNEQFARGHARELLWISAAYAKQDQWHKALDAAEKASRAHELNGQTALAAMALGLATDTSHEMCFEARAEIKRDFVPNAEKDMRQTVAQESQATGGTKTDSKDSCFIATAAYGSPFAPEVESLRQFRDARLRPHHLGRMAVRFYEQCSPPLASWLAHRPNVRIWVRRFVLSPLVWVAHRW